MPGTNLKATGKSLFTGFFSFLHYEDNNSSLVVNLAAPTIALVRIIDDICEDFEHTKVIKILNMSLNWAKLFPRHL